MCYISNFNWTKWLQISVDFKKNGFSRISKRGIILKCWIFNSWSFISCQSLMLHLFLCVFGITIAAKFWKYRTGQIKYFSWNSSFCCNNLENCRRVSLHLTHLFVHVWSCFQWCPVDKKITACWRYFTIFNWEVYWEHQFF